ncbi:GPI transamidase component PIG-S-like [Saccostrea echinata]|uniref:GPI transamidase component PIG-S-like n=1 Tax=Saccostrea echinata TaxID=191078 RepID=UPI002A7F45AA|nr:GPI transamidase component PIG-S-like [Saccostrea echinata]
MPGEDASEDKDKSIQHIAAISFGVICIVIGIPLWWKTTEVYRVSLPYSEIAELSNSKFQFTVDIDVLNLETSWTDKDLTDLSKLLKANLDDRKLGTIFPKYRVTVRQAEKKQTSDANSFKTLTELDEYFHGEDSTINKYLIVLLPHNNAVVNVPSVGNYRAVFLPVRNGDLSPVSAKITGVLHNVLVREDTLMKSFQNSLGAREPKDKESMRSLHYHQGYDLLFTLVNPQPDILNVDWSIKEAIAAYLNPLATQLSDYISLDTKSQMIFFTGLRRKPKKDSEGSGYYYEEKDLPHTINPLEAKLGSHASNNPMLNFIVYVPSRDQSPLHIVDKNGKTVKTNSFLSPQWGGIVIQNLPSPPPNSSLPVDAEVDMKTVMEVFLTQLRLLMDFSIQEVKDVKVREVENLVIREWELDNWLRKKCTENLATSISTLQSLTALLEGISNIVIQDDIGQQVENAVTGIKEAQRYLTSGQISRAFTQSRKALASSEKAFFDPSLLELLYFPEDQKFAIYIPLFLPIGLPILGSLFKAYKWIKSKRKQKLKTD